MSFLSSVAAVWRRYFAVFQKNLVYGMVTTFVEPALYLLSFGFGLGGMIGEIHGDGVAVTYRAFVLAGIVAQTVLFQSFFEASYGGFVRMYYQKIFQAISVTEVTLSEVLWGELIWDSSRATLSAAAVLLVGVLIGDFSVLGACMVLPVCFLFAMIFSALGLLVAAKSPTIEAISYPQYLLIFPMFLFCGVFFPLSNLPGAFQWAAWALPLTSTLSLTRTLTLGFSFQPGAILVGLLWLVVVVPWARSAMTRRLIH